MKGQLVKDLKTGRKDILTLAILSLIVLALIIGACIIDPDTYRDFRFNMIAYAFCIVTPLVNSIFNDEKCGYMLNAFSLPITRKEYVKGKYLYGLVNAFIGLFFMFVFLIVMVLMSDGELAGKVVRGHLLIICILFVLEIVAETFLISISMKERAIDAAIVTGVVFLVGMFSLACTTGYVKGYSDGNDKPYIFVLYIVALSIAVLALEIWLFIMGFKWAERREV